jgi:CRP/FNR family transcriptional regulator
MHELSPAICRNIRSLVLSGSAAERLAKLILEWVAKDGENGKTETRIKLSQTHEEIAQMIGTSRETVTRLFAEMRMQHIAHLKGSTLVVHDKAALKAWRSLRPDCQAAHPNSGQFPRS